MRCIIPECERETNNQYGVCDNCIAAGFTADPAEIAEAVANDPLLSPHVKIVSPIQPKNLEDENQ